MIVCHLFASFTSVYALSVYSFFWFEFYSFASFQSDNAHDVEQRTKEHANNFMAFLYNAINRVRNMHQTALVILIVFRAKRRSSKQLRVRRQLAFGFAMHYAFWNNKNWQFMRIHKQRMLFVCRVTSASSEPIRIYLFLRIGLTAVRSINIQKSFIFTRHDGTTYHMSLQQ